MSSPKTTKCSFNRSESLLIIKKLLDVFMSHVSGFFLSTNMHLTSPEPLYIPACCVEKKNKKTKNQLLRSINSVCKHFLYFISWPSVAPGQVFINYSLAWKIS